MAAGGASLPTASVRRRCISRPIRRRSSRTSGSSASRATVHAAASSVSSATTRAKSSSTSVARLAGERRRSTGRGSWPSKRRQNTSATRCSFDAKYVYAVAGATPARLATLRTVSAG